MNSRNADFPIGSVRLPLQDIYDAPRCREDQLKKVERELTEEDIDYYNEHGWKSFREEDLIETYLPELGPARYFGAENLIYKEGIVVPIKGKNYRVVFIEDWQTEPWSAEGKFISLTPTDDPETIPDMEYKGENGPSYYLKFFGQPDWVQNEVYPNDLNGKPCYHFLTIDVNWGDCGNFNILLGFNGDEPNIAYFEASCC
jgi:hypothetical protein